MAHDTLANTPEELGMIARMLRKRIEESDRKRELLVEELRLVEEKKAKLEQKA